MKTKYIKVPVSERLPEKSGLYLANWKTTDGSESWKTSHYVSIDGNCRGEWKLYVTDFLEEVPDHSEEMLSMLQRILDLNVLPAEIDDEVISLTLKAQGYDMNQIDKISQNGFEKTQQLINKLKGNGTRI
ncbi:hypothetical protein [Elizabethkingia anophelis]|uniref:Uncharacterized protein n=1 Tax=Elizabethkingia anophelis TaxID=1117645 RepID=A0AAU8VC93_9FLAO|nr:hypothetical protein [Elizabethkingia anophelis]AQX00455.1 hypothetical protein BBD32_02730 [Elizabethkingia anophelis]OPB66223.1 hypothetical protein BAY11_14760 [Elizabethkingia anophelis]